jgi:Kef-type K+ transport system membrane component KefB
MAEGSFRGLAIVAAVAFLVPLFLGLMPRLRLPSVVLEIIMGIIIGPAVLGWVQVDEPIRILSQIGLAALLFLAGLEIELDQLKGNLLRVAGGAFLLSLGLALAVSYGLGAIGVVETPLFVAILLASSALGIVIPMLKDAGESSTKFGQLVIIGLSLADFGTIILLALLFSAQSSSAGETLLLLGSIALLCVIVALASSGLGRWERLTATLYRLQETTAMIRVRGAAFLLMAFVALVEKLGLEVILGAFAAGALLGFLDRDQMKTHPQFHMRLQAVGFGVFIPIFFVTSGLQFNLGALFASRSAAVSVPLLLVALLLVRGAPAFVYRPLVGARRAVAAGLLQATSLPFIVAGARIGLALGKISQATAAALIAAGLLSVLIFPLAALTLLRVKEPEIQTGKLAEELTAQAAPGRTTTHTQGTGS